MESQTELLKYPRINVFQEVSFALFMIISILFVYSAFIKQFDTMIYPEIKDNSWINRASDKITGFFGSGPDHPRFNVPSPYKMRMQCLKIYLEPYKRGLLSGEFDANFDIQNAVVHFTDLYYGCVYQYYGTTWHVSDWEQQPLINVRLVFKGIVLDYTLLLQVIKEWIRTFIQELYQSNLGQSPKLVSAVVVMCCACRVHQNAITDSHCITLLKMMALQPNGKDFVFLTSLMKEKDSRYVQDCNWTI